MDNLKKEFEDKFLKDDLGNNFAFTNKDNQVLINYEELWDWITQNFAPKVSSQLEPPVILAKGGQLHIKIYRDDNIEGFAAYCAQDKNETKTILMNVYATFAASVENDIDAKEFIIQNLMHEFGHALEEYYNKNFDEDFIEKAVQTYFDKYHPDSPLSK